MRPNLKAPRGLSSDGLAKNEEPQKRGSPFLCLSPHEIVNIGLGTADRSIDYEALLA